LVNFTRFGKLLQEKSGNPGRDRRCHLVKNVKVLRAKTSQNKSCSTKPDGLEQCDQIGRNFDIWKKKLSSQIYRNKDSLLIPFLSLI
jgi:hypothetical protein